jgi:RNA polymerase sigma-70 factor (ECF subfamily)
MGTHLTETGFRELFERERDVLFRFLYRLTRNASDADDLLQETFLTVWRKREQFDGRGAIQGWLKRTAFRTYLNARTRLERRAALAPEATNGKLETPESELERRDSVEFLVGRVHDAIRELPDGARETFVLFRCEGLTCAEIAEVTETPLKTVETRLSRATRLLAERLRPYKGSVPTW